MPAAREASSYASIPSSITKHCARRDRPPDDPDAQMPLLLQTPLVLRVVLRIGLLSLFQGLVGRRESLIRLLIGGGDRLFIARGHGGRVTRTGTKRQRSTNQ